MKYNLFKAFSFAIRDFKERYIGTSLGQFWFIIHPIVMITIYSIIFSSVMKMKLNITDASNAYSIYLIPGILAWSSFSTLVSRLSNSFDQKKAYIKKISIPMYTFQISTLIAESIVLFISMFLAIIYLLIISHPVTITFLYLLPVMILQLLFAFSLGVILSLFTPFIKDLKVVVPIVLQLWFWMTPIVYMKEMAAGKYPSILLYNPFFYFVDIYHNIFLYSQSPSISTIFTLMLLLLIMLIIAAYLYKKMISTIKDII